MILIIGGIVFLS